jgi:hypothetical protein
MYILCVCSIFGYLNSSTHQIISITASFQHLLTQIVEKSSFLTDRCGHFKDSWGIQLSDQFYRYRLVLLSVIEVLVS